MALLDRVFQKIFGKSADSNDMGIVGSKANNNPQTSKDIAEIQSLSNWESGMRNIVSTSNAPYLQDHNSLFYVITSQLAYLFQAGIAEWESQTEYFSGKSVVLRSGKVYIAIADSIGFEPEVTSGWDTKWKVMTDWTSLTGDLKKNKDLVSYITKGYYAVCSTPRTTNIKEVTIPEFALNSGSSQPLDGTKVTVYFEYGSNTNLNDTQLKINFGNGDSIQRDILINDYSTLNRKFYATNGEIIEFVFYIGGGFYCENRISAFSRADDTTIADGRWFKIYRDGRYEEQGFYTYGGGHTSQLQITLSEELSQTNYYIGLTARGSSLGAYVDNITTTGFVVKSTGTYLSTNFNWKVEGLLKLNS